MSDGNSKVSVPPHKAPKPDSQAPVKTGSNIRGFGGSNASFTSTQPIVKESKSVKGFTGSGTKGGKV